MSDYYRINISIFMKIVVQHADSVAISPQTHTGHNLGRLWYNMG